MKKLHAQITTDGSWVQPTSPEDVEEIQAFKPNQYVEIRVYGNVKERSLLQNNLYWACCTYVAELISGFPKEYTKRSIDFKVGLRVAHQDNSFIEMFETAGTRTYVLPKSIAFSKMDHETANRYFDLAWPILANIANIDDEGDMTPEDVLIRETKNRMGR